MTSGKLALVTGGTGFIGRWVIKTLLDNGYSVRAVVRSIAKGNDLKAVFPVYDDRIEAVVIENNELDGCYDSVVQGVDAIIHLASPLPGTAGTDPEKGYLIPAREGARNILKSAAKASSVKRVVITSSAASVLDRDFPRSTARVWTEADWNPAAWEDGFKADRTYSVSKKVAEKAAWEFMEIAKPHFSLITLMPPGVYGEPVVSPPSLSDLAGTDEILYKLCSPELKEYPPSWSTFYIDVRDVALAHVKAAFAPESAANQRYNIAGPGLSTSRLIRNFLVENYPDRKVAPLGKEAAAEDVKWEYDSTKAAKTFDIEFRTFNEMMSDFCNWAFSYEK